MRVTNVVVFVAANTPVAATGYVHPPFLAAHALNAFVAAPRAGPLLEPAVGPAVLARVQHFRGSALHGEEKGEEARRKEIRLPSPFPHFCPGRFNSRFKRPISLVAPIVPLCVCARC
jgi:hypothetical protein